MKLLVSETVSICILMVESRTWVEFGVVDKLAVPILLGTTFIDGLINSIHMVERKIVHIVFGRY